MREDERVSPSSDAPGASGATFDLAASEYGRVGSSFFEHFGRRIADVAGVTIGASCLDVATGTGAAIFAAAEGAGKTARLVGSDLSQPMLLRLSEEAHVRQLPQVHAVQMDAHRLAVGDAAFDVVLCGFALDSFADPETAVAEIRRVLRPGGRFGLSVSNRWWFEGDETWAWLEGLLVSLGAELHDRPLRFTEPEQLSGLLHRHAFESVVVVKDESSQRFADFDEWWRWGWSHGYRRILDGLDEEALVRYKSEAAKELRLSGQIQAKTKVLLVSGTAL